MQNIPYILLHVDLCLPLTNPKNGNITRTSEVVGEARYYTTKYKCNFSWIALSLITQMS